MEVETGSREWIEDTNCQKACSLETQLVSSASVLNLSGMSQHSN